MPAEVAADVDASGVTAGAGTGAGERELAGLDALELAGHERASRGRRIWSSIWPRVLTVGMVLFLWELVCWSHWKPPYILPGPGPVLGQLWHNLVTGQYTEGDFLPTTLHRIVEGFILAVLIGTVVGASMSRVKVLRTGLASLVTGLQTMPSVIWFPLALVVFGLNEHAIIFVVVIGAAPSVANGILAGADQVPPILIRAGRVLGARGFTLWKDVVLPASLPSFVSGLKQGWAFAWRSLMAAELIGASLGKPGIGGFLENQRSQADYVGLYSTMILILMVGLVADALFGVAERSIRRRRGLIDNR